MTASPVAQEGLRPSLEVIELRVALEPQRKQEFPALTKSGRVGQRVDWRRGIRDTLI